jgi:hypothetical protein
MGRFALIGLVLAAVGALAPRAIEARTYEIDYATWDVKVTDTKGVTTEATEFGFYNGPNILNARRGEGYVEIPFRKIRTIEIEAYIPSKGYHPATVTSRRGKSIQVEIERSDAERFLGGDTEVGTFRIRLGQMSRLELVGLSRAEDL